MSLAKSKLTAQGQISVPASVRRELGLGPGSVIEWEHRNGEMVVRRTGTYSSKDIHKMLFPDGPPKAHTLEELKEGVAEYIREKHAIDRHKRSR